MSKVPTVAKRNDPAALEPYAKSQSTKAENVPAGFVPQWFRTGSTEMDEKLRPHEIGDATTGYLMVAGWQVCTREDGIITGRGPAAGSNTTDTTITKGDLTLCMLPVEEHAKYAKIESLRQLAVDKRLTGGERHNFGSQTTFRTRTVGGQEALDASAADILGAS